MLIPIFGFISGMYIDGEPYLWLDLIDRDFVSSLSTKVPNNIHRLLRVKRKVLL